MSKNKNAPAPIDPLDELVDLNADVRTITEKLQDYADSKVASINKDIEKLADHLAVSNIAQGTHIKTLKDHVYKIGQGLESIWNNEALKYCDRGTYEKIKANQKDFDSRVGYDQRSNLLSYKVEQFTSRTTAGLKYVGQNVLNALGDVGKLVKNLPKQAGNKFKQIILNITTAVINLLAHPWQTIKSAFTKMYESCAAGIENAKGSSAKAYNSIANKLAAGTEKIQSKIINPTVDGIKQSWRGLKSLLKIEAPQIERQVLTMQDFTKPLKENPNIFKDPESKILTRKDLVDPKKDRTTKMYKELGVHEEPGTGKHSKQVGKGRVAAKVKAFDTKEGRFKKYAEDNRGFNKGEGKGNTTKTLAEYERKRQDNLSAHKNSGRGK